MQPSPGPGLVGRDEQLRLLADELDAAHYGGRVVGLLGDPGIGKSALQQQAAQDARSLGFTVLTAQG
ncbi:MAG TPA: AAA family ATPase, partial [Jatrophihabitans sp.]|nr:AAA family ATPase [Jatrophihabitans sp.]